MTAVLGDLTWPEARNRAGSLLAVPVGATEQHGPHLPLSTDTDLAVALCQRLAARRGDVLVAPAVAYGSSGEHAGFAGTISIGQTALELLMVELVRSATETFPRVLLVCGHGGNNEPLGRAVRLLRGESRDVHLHQPRWDGDPHAGRQETSLQLVLRPSRVRISEAVPGENRPLPVLLPQLRAGGVRSVSPSGVLGDPTGAGSGEGAVLLEGLVESLCAEVAAWAPVAAA